MAILNIAPTKSNLLTLGRQLEFAEEGYDLLEQKRQILISELMSRLNRAREAEGRVAASLAPAYSVLREATLDSGSVALDRAALAVKLDHRVTISHQHLMGIRIPRVIAQLEPARPQFGPEGVSARADETTRSFVEALPLLADLAELENSIIRLSRELRKTQRRCNALLKIFIPDYRETIAYIRSTLEERERESCVILRMIRNRLAESAA